MSRVIILFVFFFLVGTLSLVDDNPYVLNAVQKVGMTQRTGNWKVRHNVPSNVPHYNPGAFVVTLREPLSNDAVDALASSAGVENAGRIGSARLNTFLFVDPLGRKAQKHGVSLTTYLDLGCQARIEKLAQLKSVVPDRELQLVTKAYPSDPEMNEAYFLWNPENCGMDINVYPIWENGTTGTGKYIGIVDDSIYRSSAELDVRTDWCYNVADSSTNSDPVFTQKGEWSHGTAVSSIAAGKAFNGICACGVAYSAKIVGIKMDASFLSSVITALGHHNDDIDVKNFSLGFAGCDADGCDLDAIDVSTKNAFADSAQNGRSGKGQNHIWAASNEGDYGGDTSMSGLAAVRYNTMVAALNVKGEAAFYTNFGAGIFVSAGGGGNGEGVASATVVSQGGSSVSLECKTDLLGTSFSSPATAGAVALILEVNNDLGWRDVKAVLALSANKTDQTDSGWTTNGGGYHVNHKYGFGAVDATKASWLAKRWTNNYGTELTLTDTHSTPTSVPALSTLDVELNINVVVDSGTCPSTALSNCNFEVEHVVLTLSMTQLGNVGLTLKSPANTVSTMMKNGVKWKTDYGYVNWPMLSNMHRGENPDGLWTLQITNTGSSSCSYTSAKLDVYGHMNGANGINYVNPSTAFVTYEVPVECHDFAPILSVGLAFLLLIVAFVSL